MLPVVATARITASGPGNLVALFHSEIAASVSEVVSTVTSPWMTTGSGSTLTLGRPGFGYPLVLDAVASAPQSVTLAAQRTGWTAPLTLQRFNPDFGQLVAVQLTLSVAGQADLALENMDAVAARVSVKQAAALSLVDSAGTVLDVAGADVTTTRMLGGYDGIIDGAGPSGASVANLVLQNTVSDTLGGPAVLAAFTGSGSVPFSVTGTGSLAVDGPGNMALGSGVQAGGTVSVSYIYTRVQDPLFDPAWYLAHNPDVAAAGVNPYEHYLTHGWLEGRNPDAVFDTRFYLAQNPDVAAAGLDPLLHFERNGWTENRAPSLLFDGAKYLAANKDVAAAGMDPLEHYLQWGRAEGRMTFLFGGTAAADPLVDPASYDRQLGATLLPTGPAAAQQAAWSYDSTGWQQGLNPDPLFDTAWYLAHNPDVAAAHMNPLTHYELYGWTEGRDPSAGFSTAKYLASYADVKAAGINPLLHYVTAGQAEGRLALPA